MPNINNIIDYLSTGSFESVQKATFNETKQEEQGRKSEWQRGDGGLTDLFCRSAWFTLGSLSNNDDDDEIDKWRKRLLKSEFALFQNSSLLLRGFQFVLRWRIFRELNSRALYVSLKKNLKSAVLCSSPPENVNLGNFTSWSCNNGTWMYRRAWGTCKVLFC